MHTLPSPTVTDMWHALKNETHPIVIYGMGNGADKLIARLGALGIPFADIFASDGFVRGHSFHGIRVKTLSEIESTYSDFVILLSFATRLDEVIDYISELDRRYTLYIPDMPVSEEEVYFDSEFYKMNYSAIELAYSRLSDDESRKTFCAVVNYKLSGKLSDLLSVTVSKDGMYSLVNSRSIKAYADVGAYSGDTLREALEYIPTLKRAVCIEPDAKTFKRLLKKSEDITKIELECINAAAWSFDGEGEMAASSNRNTSVLGSQTASFEYKSQGVRLMRLDSLGESFDYIKYDVEGAEREALSGSHLTVSLTKPVLLVSLYHKSRDIFELINDLYEKYPSYAFYLRRLRCIPAWEINLIMIPLETEGNL